MGYIFAEVIIVNIHDCIGIHMSGYYDLVDDFVLRTVIPKYEQSYNTESGQRFLKVLLV